MIANLERGQETLPFIGMGGHSSSASHGKLREARTEASEQEAERQP